MKNNKIFMGLCWVLMQSGAYAVPAVADPFSDGKTFGTAQIAPTKNSTTQASAQTTLPSYSSTVPETSTYNTAIIPTPAGLTKQSYCKTVDLGTLSEASRKECEAINYLKNTEGKRNTFTIDKKYDPLVASANSTVSNAKTTSPASINCNPSNPIPKSFSTQTCTSILQSQTFTCQKRLTVTVTPGGPTVTNLAATGGGTIGWDSSTIISMGAAGNPETLLFTYQSAYTFNIEDLSKLTEFKLVHAAWQSWLAIWVNGHLIKVWPKDGSDLKTTMVYYPGQFNMSSGLPGPGRWVTYVINGDRHLYDIRDAYYDDIYNSNTAESIDLRPYLANGTNKIDMRVVGPGTHSGQIKIETVTTAPIENDSWDNSACTALESRTK